MANEYNCNTCSLEFCASVQYAQHMVSVHCDPKPFKCNIANCQKAFKVSGALKMHQLTHLPQKPFECCLCTKTFAQKAALEIHIRRHTNQDLYNCTQCQKQFVSDAALKAHTITHTKESRFICQICSYAAPSQSALGDHLRGKHLSSRPFKCSDCAKTFAWRTALITHQKHHDGKNRTLQCSSCDYKGRWKCEVEKHEQVHAKNFSCTHCSVSYRYSCMLARHLRTHAPQQKVTAKLPEEAEQKSESLGNSQCATCGKANVVKLNHRGSNHCQPCARKVRRERRTSNLPSEIYHKNPDSGTDAQTVQIKTEDEMKINLKIEFSNEETEIILASRAILPIKCEAMESTEIKDEVKKECEQLINCPSCEQLFATESSFEDHVIVHVKEEASTCDSCHKTFTNEMDLENHRYLDCVQVGIKWQPVVTLTRIKM